MAARGRMQAVAVAVGLLMACGNSPEGGGDAGPGGDGEAPRDAATASDGPSVSDGGGGLEPGGPEGAGPALIDVQCPLLAMPASAATVFVDASAAGAGAGTRVDPYRTVRQAFDNAAPDGLIWVAAGTYRENLAIPDGNLTVQGGFAPGFAARTDACATILEAADGSQPVLSASAMVRSFAIDGLTVQKGARGLSVDGDSSVGALYTITSSVFADNGRPDAVGGAVFLDRVSGKIARSAFRDNHALKGAAVAQGGDGSSITIERTLFERNVGHSDHGGALYLSPGTGTIVRNTFRSNEIGKDVGYGWGGAAIVYKAGAAPVTAAFAHNVFTDNLASVGGGVFIDDGASATLSHDLFYRNRSIAENGVARGAALYVDGLDGPGTGSTLVADQITVVNNNLDQAGAVATARGGGVYLETYSSATFTNSIFAGNGDEALFGDPTCAIAVRYSIAPGQCAGVSTCTIGAGVLQPSDVAFVDEGANDYHEQSVAGHYHGGAWVNDAVTSPAVDKADPAASPSNEPAPNGGRANLGAFGRTSEASKSP